MYIAIANAPVYTAFIILAYEEAKLLENSIFVYICQVKSNIVQLNKLQVAINKC